MFNISDYGSLSVPMNNLQSRGDPNHHQHPQVTIVPYSQGIQQRNGRWEIVSGVKHVFTKTIFGHKETNRMGDKNSILNVPLAEREISRVPFITNLKSSTTSDSCHTMDDENSSALNQTTDNIGESNCQMSLI